MALSEKQSPGSAVAKKDEKDSIDQLISNMISPEESKTISIIMQTMLPSMFGLFSNITSEDFKANFKEPCKFDALMDIFKQLPPYFDIISAKYPNKPDIAAYYSMQLASTFLVNNGSLTMACLYNMLSLQTRLMKFSLNIMDNPENHPELVGLFGIFMKPVMSMLKKNSMMKIIDHVDRYDKNDDLNTINLFNILNFFYCLIGLFGIACNVFLIILLKRSYRKANKKPIKNNNNGKVALVRANIYESKTKSSLKQHQQSMQLQPLNIPLHATIPVTQQQPNGSLKKKKRASSGKRAVSNSNIGASELNTKSNSERKKTANRKTRSKMHNNKKKKKEKSEYALVKSVNNQFNKIIRKRYKTRLLFIVIAVCHSLYILMNFIVMSQAGLAAVALQGLSQLNIACKLSFFLFPPTTAYNFLHQICVWLLFYAIFKHSKKLRNTMTHNFDRAADYDVNLMSSDEEDEDEGESSSESSSEEEEDTSSQGGGGNKKRSNNYDSLDESNEEEEDTVSQSLTNNSSIRPIQSILTNNQLAIMTQPSGEPTTFPLNITSPNNVNNKVQFMDNNSSTLSRNNNINNNNPYANIIQPYNYNSNNANAIYQSRAAVLANANGGQFSLYASVQDPRLLARKQLDIARKYDSKPSLFCLIFDRKSRNALFCLVLFALLFVYNSQNIFFYSLIELKTAKNEIITYCAFEESYADYYNILNQYIVPLLNLCLFSLIPLLLCTMQVLFDVCFLIRVQREQTKRYEKLKEIIEWPLYSYYLVYIVSQLPFAAHQISDLILGTSKFPFVFPIFIRMKFTSQVWLVIFEMTLIMLAYSVDLFIWLVCDKHLRQLAKNWLNKRMLCRTYSSGSSSPPSSSTASTSSTSSSSTSSSITSIKQQNRKMKLSSLSSSSNSNGGVSSSCHNSDSNYLTLNLAENGGGGGQSNNNNNNAKNVKVTDDTTGNVKKANTGHVKNANNNGYYASSTLSSTSSSILNSQNTTGNGNGKKKSISPTFVDAVKATASISASASFQYSELAAAAAAAANNGNCNNQTSSTTKLPTLNYNIQQGIMRMIDTDNETDNEQMPTSPLNMTDLRLEKLEENEELKNKLKPINYDSQPPSFKTATSRTSQYSQLLNENNNSSGSSGSRGGSHQYENHFDFNNKIKNDINNKINNTQSTNDM